MQARGGGTDVVAEKVADGNADRQIASPSTCSPLSAGTKEAKGQGGLGAARASRARPAVYRHRGVQCPRHPDEPARFACLDCRCEVLCAACYSEGLHTDHELVNIRTAVPSVRMKMTDQYVKLKHQAQELETLIASLKSIQKKAARIHAANALQIKEAFESVIRSLDQRNEAALREIDVVRNVSAQSLKSLDVDCQTLLRYLRLKKQQLLQLHTLAAHSPVLALNSFAEIAPTIEAVEQKSDFLADMRERLRVPHWQLRVFEIDFLLEDRQTVRLLWLRNRQFFTALQDLSSQINTHCEHATQAVDSFLSIELPLDGPPAEHREADKLPEVVLRFGAWGDFSSFLERRPGTPFLPIRHTWRLAERVLLLLLPLSAVCLLSAPDKVQAFVRKDALHPVWEVRVVSLRGPYLCIHQSEEDANAPVESVVVLGHNTFARTFADPGITALAAVAKKDYLHGIEVVTVDLQAKELQNFVLLAADGQLLSEEWALAIEELCSDGMETEPEAPGHDPKLSLEDLHLEAAEASFPVSHRRKAAHLPTGLGGDKDEGVSPEASLWGGETAAGYERSNASTDSSGEAAARGTLVSRRDRQGSSLGLSASDTDDAEAEYEEALMTVAAPQKPTIQRDESGHWERDAVPGDLYQRRRIRRGGAGGGRSLAQQRGHSTTRDEADSGGSSSAGSAEDRFAESTWKTRSGRGGRSEGAFHASGSGGGGAANSVLEGRARLVHRVEVEPQIDKKPPVQEEDIQTKRRVQDRVRELEARISPPKVQHDIQHHQSPPDEDAEALTPPPDTSTLDLAVVSAHSEADAPDKTHVAGSRTTSYEEDRRASKPPARQLPAFLREPQVGDSPPEGESNQPRNRRLQEPPSHPAATMTRGTSTRAVARLAKARTLRAEHAAPPVASATAHAAGSSPLATPSRCEASLKDSGPKRQQAPTVAPFPGESRRRPRLPQEEDAEEFVKVRMPPRNAIPAFEIVRESSTAPGETSAADTDSAANVRVVAPTRIRKVSVQRDPPGRTPYATEAPTTPTPTAATPVGRGRQGRFVTQTTAAGAS
ncbi:uncharacterized protein LOC113146627 [Cyclospora cayetanensis]|uniref:Uncharacterized protein LOC113146627 n=1 Tax=Cyclospora cayetanensis TaxID=88456 RepID=A0A6P6RTC6_9EIME|nr:uncharacterized protein LOC113146627 [Cyclospora cayetanensis]